VLPTPAHHTPRPPRPTLPLLRCLFRSAGRARPPPPARGVHRGLRAAAAPGGPAVLPPALHEQRHGGAVAVAAALLAGREQRH